MGRLPQVGIYIPKKNLALPLSALPRGTSHKNEMLSLHVSQFEQFCLCVFKHCIIDAETIQHSSPQFPFAFEKKEND